MVTIVEMKSYAIWSKTFFQSAVLDLIVCCFQWGRTRGKIIFGCYYVTFFSASISIVCMLNSGCLLKVVALIFRQSTGPTINLIYLIVISRVFTLSYHIYVFSCNELRSVLFYPRSLSWLKECAAIRNAGVIQCITHYPCNPFHNSG